MSKTNAQAEMEKKKGSDKKREKWGDSFVNLMEESLAQMIPLVTRPLWLSAVLIFLHMMELLAQAIPNKLEFASSFMPILHSYLQPLNFKSYSSQIRTSIIYYILSGNFCFLFSFLVIIKIKRRKKLWFIALPLRFFCVNFMRFYVHLIMVPGMNICAGEILNLSGNPQDYNKFVASLCWVTTALLSIFLTNWLVDYSFSIKDHLTTFPSFGNILLLILKWLSCIVFYEENPDNVSISLVLFSYFLCDYVIRLPHSSRSISILYINLILVCLLISFSYTLIINKVLQNGHMDPSLFIVIGSSLLVRLGTAFRAILMSRRIFNKSMLVITDEAILNIYAHEVKQIFEKIGKNDDIQSCAEIMHVVRSHLKGCEREECPCKHIDMSEKMNWEEVKNIVWHSISEVFRSSQGERTLNIKQRNMLNYCSFITDIERVPNKALHILFKNETKLNSFNSKINLKIINKKCKRLYSKHMEGLKGMFLNFADLIIFENEVENLELNCKQFLFDYLEFMVKLQFSKDEDMSKYAQNNLASGAALSEAVVKLKKDLLKLLSENSENLRLFKIAFRLMKIFDEDGEFENLIRRLEIKRIHLVRAREKATENQVEKSSDLFNPSAGVIFLNMSDAVGRIEKASRSIIGILQTTAQEVIGKNIKIFMPDMISTKHDELLNNFIKSEKAILLREKGIMLFALDKRKYLLNVNLNIKVDTFFADNFLMSGLLTLHQNADKSLITDELGNIINFTEKLDLEVNLGQMKKTCKKVLFNICVLIPQLYWIYFPQKGKEDSFQKEIDLSELKVLFLGPQLEIGKSIMGKTSFMKQTIAKESTGLPGQLYNSNEESLALLYSHILGNIEISDRFYSMNVDLRRVSYASGSIKLVSIIISDLALLEDEDQIFKNKEIRLGSFKAKEANLYDLSDKIMDPLENNNIALNTKEANLSKLTFIKKTISYDILNKAQLSELDIKEMYNNNKDTSYDHSKEVSMEQSYNKDVNEIQEEVLFRRTKSSISKEENEIEDENPRSRRLEEKIMEFPVNFPSSANLSKSPVPQKENNIFGHQEMEEDNQGSMNEISRQKGLVSIKIPDGAPKKKYGIPGKRLANGLVKVASMKKSAKSMKILLNDPLPMLSRSSDSFKTKNQMDNLKDNPGMNRSEAASSSASSGNLQSLVRALFESQTREMRTLKFLVVILYMGVIGSMVFSWEYNTSSFDSILSNLESSLFIQDLIMPLSLLMKNFVIVDFKKNGLFQESKGTVQPLFEYLEIAQNKTRAVSKNAYNIRLRLSPFASKLLLEHKIEMQFPDFMNADVIYEKKEIDLERGYGLFITMLTSYENLDTDDLLYKKAELFLIFNFLPFAKEFIKIFDDIVKSINYTMDSIENMSKVIIYSTCGGLAFFYLYIFYCSFKIKSDTQRLALSLRHFDRNTLNSKINQISVYLQELYPSTIYEVQQLTDLGLHSNNTLTKSQNQGKGAELVKKMQAKANTNNNNSKNKKKKIETKYATTSPRVFVWILLFVLSLLYLIPISVYLVNDYLLSNFNDKVEKIVSTKEGIQMFTISFTTFVALKHLDYCVSTKDDSLKVIQKDVRDYMLSLNSIMVSKSNPAKILEKEDEFPDLVNINSEFYFSNICEVLIKNKIQIDYTKNFNSNTCFSIFYGLLTRGTKSLSMDIKNLIQNWDLILSKYADIKSAISDNVLNTEEFNSIQNSLNLLKALEEIALLQVTSTLKKYMDPFKSQEALWLAAGLSLILLSFTWVFFVLLRTLRLTYRNSVAMLNNFSSHMIVSNKILMARMDELFRRT